MYRDIITSGNVRFIYQKREIRLVIQKRMKMGKGDLEKEGE